MHEQWIVDSCFKHSFLEWFLNVFITRLDYFFIPFFFNFQIENMKCKDKRLKIMNEILNGIKVRS